MPYHENPLSPMAFDLSPSLPFATFFSDDNGIDNTGITGVAQYLTVPPSCYQPPSPLPYPTTPPMQLFPSASLSSPDNSPPQQQPSPLSPEQQLFRYEPEQQQLPPPQSQQRPVSLPSERQPPVQPQQRHQHQQNQHQEPSSSFQILPYSLPQNRHVAAAPQPQQQYPLYQQQQQQQLLPCYPQVNFPSAGFKHKLQFPGIPISEPRYTKSPLQLDGDIMWNISSRIYPCGCQQHFVEAIYLPDTASSIARADLELVWCDVCAGNLVYLVHVNADQVQLQQLIDKLGMTDGKNQEPADEAIQRRVAVNQFFLTNMPRHLRMIGNLTIEARPLAPTSPVALMWVANHQHEYAMQHPFSYAAFCARERVAGVKHPHYYYRLGPVPRVDSTQTPKPGEGIHMLALRMASYSASMIRSNPGT